MSIFMAITDGIVPFVIISIVLYGMSKGVAVYDSFIRGAKKGLGTVIKIMPTLIGLMAAVGVFRASGLLELAGTWIGKLTTCIGFPGELVPLAIVRMFSSSAATGLALDIFKEYGTDSYFGILASIMMSCTETIFYTMSVYFMTARVKKTRYTLPGALAATLAGIAASVWIAGYYV